MSSELPPRCQGICPLEGKNWEDYPLVLTRNCEGPVMGTGEVTTQDRLWTDGKIETSDLENVSSIGRLVCQNHGLFDSIKALRVQQPLA